MQGMFCQYLEYYLQLSDWRPNSLVENVAKQNVASSALVY